MKVFVSLTLLTAAAFAQIAIAESPDAKPATSPVRITGPVEVSKRMTPVYPAAAQSQRKQGRAVIDVAVSEKGTPLRTEPVSGDPLLVAAFSEAAMKWAFVPYKQDGHPTAFITRIGMDFVLMERPGEKTPTPMVTLAAPGADIGGIQGLSPEVLALDPKIMEGKLVNRLPPTYPALARTQRISGTVTLKAIIGKDGHIQNLTVVSGHPMLAQSALNAVKQWRYSPYTVNGEPVNVETTITVRFNLGG